MNDDDQVHPQTINIQLCDYIDRQTRALEQKWAIRHDALAEEYKKSEVLRKEAKDDMDKRLETMNEFRAQLSKQASTFMTSEQVDTKIQLALNQQTKYNAILVLVLVAALGCIGYFLGVK